MDRKAQVRLSQQNKDTTDTRNQKFLATDASRKFNVREDGGEEVEEQEQTVSSLSALVREKKGSPEFYTTYN